MNLAVTDVTFTGGYHATCYGMSIVLVVAVTTSPSQGIKYRTAINSTFQSQGLCLGECLIITGMVDSSRELYIILIGAQAKLSGAEPGVCLGRPYHNWDG